MTIKHCSKLPRKDQPPIITIVSVIGITSDGYICMLGKIAFSMSTTKGLMVGQFGGEDGAGCQRVARVAGPELHAQDEARRDL
jgi:hypothetical protein